MSIDTKLEEYPLRILITHRNDAGEFMDAKEIPHESGKYSVLECTNSGENFSVLCLSRTGSLGFHLNLENIQEDFDEHIRQQDFSMERLSRDSELIKLVGKLSDESRILSSESPEYEEFVELANRLNLVVDKQLVEVFASLTTQTVKKGALYAIEFDTYWGGENLNIIDERRYRRA